VPCYTVRRTTVDLAVAQPELLAAAFKQILGMRAQSVSVTAGQIRGDHADGLVYWADGKLYLPASLDANVFKRAYAAEAVKAAAKKQNWQVAQPAASKFLVTKGGW
jgi:hypothetical protein